MNDMWHEIYNIEGISNDAIEVTCKRMTQKNNLQEPNLRANVSLYAHLRPSLLSPKTPYSIP
jgi:hypothetical protein